MLEDVVTERFLIEIISKIDFNGAREQFKIWT